MIRGTDIREQAERWAVRKAKIMSRKGNDNVGETVSYVMQGIMRKEDAVSRLKFEKVNNQIAFCSEAALSQLVFVSSYIVEK